MIELFRLHLLSGFAFVAILSGCAAGKLADVSLTPSEAPIFADVLGSFESDEAVRTGDEWKNRRVPLLREAFARSFYGEFPDEFEIVPFDVQRIDDDIYGLGTLDFVPLKIRTRFDGGAWHERNIRLLIAKPRRAVGQVPTILKMDFCPSAQVFQIEGLWDEGWKCGPVGFNPVGNIVWRTLGRYHISPPIEEMLSRGYAYASIHVSDYVPDNNETAEARLDELSNGADRATSWGSLAAWAFQYSRAIDYLDGDDDLDPARTVVYGHSRFGKSALIAGAFDDRIDGVIAHQTGRGGAALTRSANGEPILDMVQNYPTWLSEKYSTSVKEGKGADLPFDQHQLIAMLAPRPVLLGHSRRDSWSDPNGAFQSARGASSAYELLGSDGFTAKILSDFEPAADIAYWMRGGTHGETEEDWSAFFEFLGAHF